MSPPRNHLLTSLYRPLSRLLTRRHPTIKNLSTLPTLPEEQSKSPWRDSASLILTSPGSSAAPGLPGHPGDPKPLPQFLITKRSKSSSFVPNILCFPGGHIDPADHNKCWINLFGMMSGSDIREVKFLSDTADIPNIYGRDSKSANRTLRDMFQVVPHNVSLRITAIRETFEECGILLCRTSEKSSYGKGLGTRGGLGVGGVVHCLAMENPDEVEEWQMKVKKDPMEFHNLCRKKTCYPDLNALVEWSNWLTPNSFPAQRFDTLFFMAIAPMPLPYLIDPFEVASARWTTAKEVLNGAGSGKAKLIPPQIYELTRLRNTKLDRLKQLMKMRLQLGIERLCPCYFKVKDGVLSVFPGDDLYPVDYNIEKFEEIREVDSTLEDLRVSTSSHHRIEFKTEYDFNLLVNIGPRTGQIYID